MNTKKPAWKNPYRMKKVKAVLIAQNGLRRSGSVLLSHSLICSTIAAERLNFRVRNGNGWIPLAIATEKVVGIRYSLLVIRYLEINKRTLLLISNNKYQISATEKLTA
jgi:hypothetical protein